MTNSATSSNPAGKEGQSGLWSPALSAALEGFVGLSRGTTPVLIVGERGTGKESLARAIHLVSERSHGPFVTVDCLSVAELDDPEPLLGKRDPLGGVESAFERADGGTLILDEIVELGPELQTAVIQVIRTATVQRQGGSRAVPVDVRLIGTISGHLRSELDSGRILAGLYQAFSTEPLLIPPLRERSQDIVPLARHFLSLLIPPDRPIPELTEPTLALLKSYSWPGNLRELREAMRHIVSGAAGDAVLPEHLPPNIQKRGRPGVPNELLTLEEMERRHIERVLAATGRDLDRSVEILGIDRKLLERKLRQHGLS